MKPARILLTTDLSPEAQRAFEPVARLARTLGAKLTLLHVVQPLMEEPEDAHLGAPVVGSGDGKAAEDALQKVASSLPSDLDVSLRLVTDVHVADAIVREARELDAGLIALSTHGRSGLRRLILGSVAEEVLRRSPVPVLCFPPSNEEPGELRHLLLTTDRSDEALRPFEPVLSLARELGAKVTVLHVVPELQAIPHGAAFAPAVSAPDVQRDVRRAREELAAQCSTLGDGVELAVEVLHDDDPARAIADFAAKHDVDVIALSTHGRTGFRRLGLGSVAEAVLRASPVPVLSFHRPED